MPTLLAPQQGMTCPCRLERCLIRTQDCRFYSLVHCQWATTSPTNEPPHPLTQKCCTQITCKHELTLHSLVFHFFHMNTRSKFAMRRKEGRRPFLFMLCGREMSCHHWSLHAISCRKMAPAVREKIIKLFCVAVSLSQSALGKRKKDWRPHRCRKVYTPHL